MANYQQGENYISGNNVDYANDYSNNTNNNYANGNEMVDLNARRKAALAEVNSFAQCPPLPLSFLFTYLGPCRLTTPSSAGSTFVPVLSLVSVSIPILTIFSLSVWSPPCLDGFTMLLPIRLRKLSAGFSLAALICLYLGVLPDQAHQRAALPNVDDERQLIFNIRRCLLSRHQY